MLGLCNSVKLQCPICKTIHSGIGKGGFIRSCQECSYFGICEEDNSNVEIRESMCGKEECYKELIVFTFCELRNNG